MSQTASNKRPTGRPQREYALWVIVMYICVGAVAWGGNSHVSALSPGDAAADSLRTHQGASLQVAARGSQNADSTPADSAFNRHLGEVVVYGERNLNREVIPSQTLSGEQLQGLNSHSVADAIRYFAGVQLKDYGGVGGVKTLDIRSMGTNHMGIFYDGIQLGNAQNGQIDLGRYSLDNIESITLYNGQKSNVFQGAKDFGNAGTVYITTRHPSFAPGKRTNLNVTFRTGSFGLANPSFRIEQKLSDAVSLSLNSEYTYANGRYKFTLSKKMPDGSVAWDTTATRRNGQIHALRVEAGLFGRVTNSHWYGKLYYYDSDRGIPGAIVNNVFKNSQKQWDRNFFAQGSWQRRFGSYETRINAKYARDYMRYLNPDTTLMYLDNKFHQDELYISSANCYTILPGWEADLSVDYQWNHMAASLVNFAKPVRHTALAALATAWRRGPLKAQGSLLFSHVSDRSSIVNNGETLGHRTRSLTRWTPAIFLSWRPGVDRGPSLRAFYKRTFRMPTFNDLYYTDIGNVDLKPEYATQYNIGVNYDLTFSSPWVDGLSLSADGYHNRISDKIIAVPKGTGQYRWMMMNIGKVRIWGLDLTVQCEFSLPGGVSLNARGSYTFQRAMDYSDPHDNIGPEGTYKGQIAYIPRHSGSATLQGAWRGLQLNYSFIYVGERYHNSSNIPVNYEQPWYTSDLALSYRFLVGKSAFKASVEVNNLFNQQYEVILNYPMPGRNFKVILQWDI